MIEDFLVEQGEVLSPEFNASITVYPSAVATFYAPSDLSGARGYRRERIRAMRQWRGGPGRYDNVFIRSLDDSESISESDHEGLGLLNVSVAQVRLFFSFELNDNFYRCALVRDYDIQGDEVDEDTGMWLVRRAPRGRRPRARVVDIDRILRAAHLIPYFEDQTSTDLTHEQVLDHFRAFYVNKFADHHAFKILS